MTDEIAIREETGFSPKEIALEAREQARVLMDIVEQQTLYVTIGKKKHLVAEAWQTICAFNNANPITEWVRPVEEDGVIVAWQARVVLYKNGEPISSGEMTCGLEEFPCRGKEGHAKDRAAQSSAQTWAMAKAARMKFAWVAVLGGYAATPAEEMLDTVTEREVPLKALPASPNMLCPIHHVRWYKSGRMRSFAHAVPGEPWCEMDAVLKSQTATVTTQGGQGDTEGTEPDAEEEGAY